MTLDLFQLIGGEHHVPDILECFANLSSNEIPTSPELTNKILDLLPEEVWSDPTLRWLEPSATTGVFLREAAARLMVGLETTFPNETERREHILTNMLFGIAQTALSAEIARRSLYYSRDAASDHSVVQFGNPEGNIAFEQGRHSFANGKCRICGAPEALERGDALENYSYSFIHMTREDKEDTKMKFDVIVGNPPYQLEDTGFGAAATPIYQHFVEQAFSMNPRYVVFIIPARWYAGGKRLDAFRDLMLNDGHLSHLVDYPDASECFPGVDIKGGVCYFLRDRTHSGKCELVNVLNGKKGKPYLYDLGKTEVFIRFGQAHSVLEKVRDKEAAFYNEVLSSREPFGFMSNYPNFTKTKSSGQLLYYMRGGTAWVDESSVKKNAAWIDKWKVLLPKASDGSGTYPQSVLAKPIIAKPGEVCSGTYLVAGAFDTEREAINCAEYLKTRTVRFLTGIRKNTQDLTKDKMSYVPNLSMNQTWTDKELYKRYNLTPDEIAFIESQIKAMP